MVLVEHDDVVEQFAAEGADDPLAVGILPRRSGGGPDRFDAERLQTVVDFPAEDAIVVMNQEPRCLVERERLLKLLVSVRRQTGSAIPMLCTGRVSSRPGRVGVFGSDRPA